MAKSVTDTGRVIDWSRRIDRGPGLILGKVCRCEAQPWRRYDTGFDGTPQEGVDSDSVRSSNTRATVNWSGSNSCKFSSV